MRSLLTLMTYHYGLTSTTEGTRRADDEAEARDRHSLASNVR